MEGDMAKRILVVDDEPILLDFAMVRLKKAGYDIIGAVNAEEAMDTAQKAPPDLILLDLVLPKMWGDELCKKLKSDEKFKHIPIILFTAKTIRPILAEKLKEIGADDFIMKPFESQELLTKIKKFIG